MAVTVDIEPGLLTVTPDETGGLPVVINGAQIVVDAGVLSIRKQATLVSVAAPTGYVDKLQYKVQLDLTNGRMQEVLMGQVTNHPDWTNDEPGVELAVEEIKVAMTSGGGGGGGTVTNFSFVDANGFAGQVDTATTTPALELSTTVGDTQVVVANGGALMGSAALTHDGDTLYSETAALNTAAIHGYSTNGGEGVRAESTTGSGVEGIATTGTGVRATNASTTNPTLHTNNTDATNAGPLVYHHNTDGDGVEIANDGSLDWTTTTGAPNTALHLQPLVVTESGTSHDIVLTDLNTIISTTNSGAVGLEIQTQANVAYPDGFIFYVLQTGTGQATVTGDAGVTVVSSRSTATYAQYSLIGFRRLAADSWLGFGDTE